MKKENNLNFGLVLSGGLAKGANQFGFIKALLEYVPRENIKIVSSSSVGIINAYGICTNNMERLEKLWNSLDYPSTSNLIYKNLFQNNVSNVLKTFILPSDEADIPFYACLLLFPLYPQFRYYKVFGSYYKNWLSLVRGGISFPFFTGLQPLFRGRLAFDGSTCDNIPIYPLVKCHSSELDVIIVLHFDPRYSKEKIINKTNAVVIDIDCSLLNELLYPSFNFNQKMINSMVDTGYKYGKMYCKKLFSNGFDKKEIAQKAFEIEQKEFHSRMSKQTIDRVVTILNMFTRWTRNKYAIKILNPKEEEKRYQKVDILSIIRDKRDGKELTNEQIKYFVKSYSNGDIPDYQVSALLMAIYLQKLTKKEATTMAIAMRDSGEVVDLSAINGLKVDKHSTGGVGDKVSLVLAPIVASCGLKFAKMSGRGLGHTGGTIDKLEAIKGFSTTLSTEQFIKQVNDIGIAIIGQSQNITPADKKLYALRDVTETVNNTGLIASSIMSKKLASGSDIIILDVKYGSGAFMKTIKDASELASLMVEIGNNAGKKVEAIITGMDEPLGHKIGNALEIYEVLEALQGRGPKDLMDVVYTIASRQLVLGQKATNDTDAKQLIDKAISSGKALETFKQFITAQGGSLEQINNSKLLLDAEIYELKAETDGYINSFATEQIGNAARVLGAGRLNLSEKIDNYVGLDIMKKIGEKVEKGDVICKVYHHQKGLDECLEILKNSIVIGKKSKKPLLIAKIIK